MLTKYDLLITWIDLFKDKYSIGILNKGQKLSKEKIIDHLEHYCLNHKKAHDFVYLLCIINISKLIPVYIGKSVDPVKRWKSHLEKLLKGKGSYQRWKDILFEEKDIGKEELTLLVIPDNCILLPPIPHFPTTVGSVEYQLISLVSDVYPETLLNHEGNRR